MPRPRVLTTLYFPHRPDWVARVDMLDPEAQSIPGRLWTLLRRAPAYDVVILNGSGHDDQMAAILLRRLRPTVSLVLTDCTWKVEGSWLARILNRLGVRLIDGPRTSYCVLSAAEKRRFPVTWGVDPARVFVTHWYVGWSEEEESAPVADKGYVFSGGDSMRDYRALVEASRKVRSPVRIATHLPPPVAESELPKNLTFGPMAPDEYFRAMREASVVVVCLEADSERSAGQNNYLGPMALGKLVVINDTTGVREYVEHGRTALVVASCDPDALAATLQWALDPDNTRAVREIVERGRRDVIDRFPPESYSESLIRVAETVASNAG